VGNGRMGGGTLVGGGGWLVCFCVGYQGGQTPTGWLCWGKMGFDVGWVGKKNRGRVLDERENVGGGADWLAAWVAGLGSLFCGEAFASTGTNGGGVCCSWSGCCSL
jgi:hypothetical protein